MSTSRRKAAEFAARHAIHAVLEPWFVARPLAQIREAFDRCGVLWGVYQDFKQLVEEDHRCSTANPLVGELDQPGIGRIRSVRTPLSFTGNAGPVPSAAPILLAAPGDVMRLTVFESHVESLPEKYREGGRRGWPVILSGLKMLLERPSAAEVRSCRWSRSRRATESTFQKYRSP